VGIRRLQSPFCLNQDYPSPQAWIAGGDGLAIMSRKARIVQKESVGPLEFAGEGLAGHAAKADVDTRTPALAKFIGLLALVWIVLEGCYTAFPMIRPGADIVLEAKFESLVQGHLFLPSDRFRILVFGNSKTMAGFRPEEFDAAFSTEIRSYNLGLPGDARFLPILKAALAAGNIPTHVFLTMPWDNKPKPTLLDYLRDDESILYTLIPFRDLPRDVVAFVATSHFQFAQKYAEAARERAKMLAQRGWYYIKGQSFFPSGELPDDYSIPTDHPDEFLRRDIPATSFILSELVRLEAQYHFKVVFIPGNMRRHAEAAAPESDQDRGAGISASADIRIVGPDYWVYPPADFSDPVHMNPAGATAYTHDLAQLIAKSGMLN
jgi:hypothetical protein